MRKFLVLVLFVLLLPAAVFAGSGKNLLIKNVEIFDGLNEKTKIGNVLVVNGFISKISEQPIVAAEGTKVIDGQGKFLMPGLIDSHYHVILDQIPFSKFTISDTQYLAYWATRSAHDLLFRGFTTIRDVGGNSLSLKIAIDEGVVIGPRIYSSGGTITQTGGHNDFRGYTEVPAEYNRSLTYLERVGHLAIADGVDQVLMRAREQLRNGAVMLKVQQSGGVVSMYDPIDVVQYTHEELRAAVQVAESWGTFVEVHSYSPKSIKMALDAGVKVIEHGQMMDEESARLIAEKGAWVSTQIFLNDEDATVFPKDHPAYEKQLAMMEGTPKMFEYLKKHNVKTAWGTDTVFSSEQAKRQNAQIVKLLNWYSPFEALKMVTATNGELLKLCGKRNPYPHTIGVLEEGAYADMLLIDGSPLKNLELIADPVKNFKLIIKDGVVYKNTL